MIGLTPAMTGILATIGGRAVCADEMRVNGVVMRRLAELGFLNIDMEKVGRLPPIYSLSAKGEGAAAALNAVIHPFDREQAIARIQRTVAQHFHIPLIEMVSARRSRQVARPRQIAMYLAKETTPKSLPDIGRRFGGRDHTTVIHAIHKVTSLMAADSAFRLEVESLKAAILSKAVDSELMPAFYAASPSA